MVSVIICSAEAGRLFAAANQWRAVFGTAGCDVVTVYRPRSLAAGYNAGLRAAKGEIIIFCHDDVETMAPNFAARLQRHMERFDVIGVAGTDRLVAAAWVRAGQPHIFGQVLHETPGNPLILTTFGTPAAEVGGMQALDGVFLAFRRAVIEAIGWDEETFRGFHLYDVDTTFRAYLAGQRIGVAMDLHMVHRSGGKYDAAWKASAEAFMRKHGARLSPPVMEQPVFDSRVVESRAEALALMERAAGTSVVDACRP